MPELRSIEVKIGGCIISKYQWLYDYLPRSYVRWVIEMLDKDGYIQLNMNLDYEQSFKITNPRKEGEQIVWDVFDCVNCNISSFALGAMTDDFDIETT